MEALLHDEATADVTVALAPPPLPLPLPLSSLIEEDATKPPGVDGDGDGEGSAQFFMHAHTAVLRRVPYFDALFSHDFRETSQTSLRHGGGSSGGEATGLGRGRGQGGKRPVVTVEVDGVGGAELEAFLRFVYTGRLAPSSPEAATGNGGGGSGAVTDGGGDDEVNLTALLVLADRMQVGTSV